MGGTVEDFHTALNALKPAEERAARLSMLIADCAEQIEEQRLVVTPIVMDLLESGSYTGHGLLQRADAAENKALEHMPDDTEMAISFLGLAKACDQVYWQQFAMLVDIQDYFTNP